MKRKNRSRIQERCPVHRILRHALAACLLLGATAGAVESGPPRGGDRAEEASRSPRAGKVLVLASAEMFADATLQSVPESAGNILLLDRVFDALVFGGSMEKLRLRRGKGLAPETASLLGELSDIMKVTYYFFSSAAAPRKLAGDVQGVLDEFAAAGKGKFKYRVVDPTREATEFAERKTTEYLSRLLRGEKPEEPKPPETIEDLFQLTRGRVPTPDGSRGMLPPQDALSSQRRAYFKSAENQRQMAVQQYLSRLSDQNDARSDEMALGQLLLGQWEEYYLEKLRKEGIEPYSFAVPNQGGDAGIVTILSALKLTYLDREPFIAPFVLDPDQLKYMLARGLLAMVPEKKPLLVLLKSTPGPASPIQRLPVTESSTGFSMLTKGLGALFDVAVVNADGADLRPLGEGRWTRPVRSEYTAASDPRSPPADAREAPAQEQSPIACLIVLGPRRLPGEKVREISRAIAAGVPTVFLTSSFQISPSMPWMRRAPSSAVARTSTGLEDLFGLWGLELGDRLLKSSKRKGPSADLLEGPEVSIRRESPWTRDEEIEEVFFPATGGLRCRKETLDANGIRSTILVETAPGTVSIAGPIPDRVSLPPGFTQPSPAPPKPDQPVPLPPLPQGDAPVDQGPARDPTPTPLLEPMPLAVLLEGTFPILPEPPRGGK